MPVEADISANTQTKPAGETRGHEPAVSRIALVTGGARGIGAAISERLARDGHRVVITDIDTGALDQEAESLRKSGAKVLPIRADHSDPDAPEAIAKTVEDQWGPIEILVNNAGITRDGLIVRMSLEDWQKVLSINLTGAFLMSKRCARGMMKAHWGRIINIASVVGQMGNAGQANYVAAKAGLIGLTKTLALELAPRQVTVNAIAPGFIETGMTAVLPEEVKATYRSHIPLGRFGTPGDVAAVIAFLCSPDAQYITGQTIRVDGGMVLA